MTVEPEDIHESRLLLQNPYAYLDGDGNITADQISVRKKPERLSLDVNTIRNPKLLGTRIANRDIEKITRELQLYLWEHREGIWGERSNIEPIGVLNPEVVFGLLGFKYDGSASLGEYRTDSGMAEIAGCIDRSSMFVGISNQFPPAVQNYTAAHELGHAMLHNTNTMHRDRPLSNSAPSGSRVHTEIEADKFASIFLMPAKLVRNEFEGRFGEVPFEISDDSAFCLTSQSKDQLKNSCRSSRELSRLLASCNRYGRNRFESMAEYFNVSTEAMAIRLEELKLLKFH